MACRILGTAGVAVISLVLASAAFAQASPAAPRFDINGYAVEGAPLLRSEDFSRIVSPYIGKQKTASDVQKAQQALQQAYLDLGHCSVQVTVPKMEPDAGTVTLRLVQSTVPISKNCLPMMVLDDKRAAPVPVAPGEVAVRPFNDVTQAAAEPPSPSATSSQQVARAPLKPLQDRPRAAAPASSPPTQPEVAVVPLPRDTAADVSVKSLAQAQPQPGLIVTPSAPAPVEKTVVAAPAPQVAIASAPVVASNSPPEITVAPAAESSTKVEPPPASVAPKIATPVTPAAVAVEPVKAESPAAPTVAAKPVEKPAQDVIAMASVKPELVSPKESPVVPTPVTSASEPVPNIVAVENPKPVVPIAVASQSEAAPVPKVQPAVEPVKEQLVAKAEPVPVAQPAVAGKVIEKPVPADVVVQPFAGAVATAPEPRVPVEVKPEVERAPVRPLQDRQSVPVQDQAPLRVVEATEQKPAAKPSAVVVQAPAVSASSEPAAPVEAAALKFNIERYLIEGNTLLSQATISKVLGSYTGKQKDFGDVQRALEALQIAYQNAGWGTVQVTLPEQELERGEVRFEVTETRIGKVEVQGNEHHSEANVRRSIPSLKEGQTPNSIAIARSLKVANENPIKQSQVSLKAGSKDGEVDATVKVVDENPRKYSISLDNTGTSNTGRFRLGFAFQNANLWDRDHQLTLQYITNPENVNKVTVFGLGYHIPLYARGDSVDLVLGYSDVDSGTLNQLFIVSGAGTVALGRYNQNLTRIGDYEHKITYGLDYKAFSNKVTTLNGNPLVPDITLHPISVTYSGALRKDVTDLSFYAGFTYHPFPGGNDGASSNFSASRGCVNGSDTPSASCTTGATGEYSIWRYGGNYTHLLPKDWTARATFSGQYTTNALVAGEQFGLGGANSVRGFNERAYSNDRGYQASFELYTPDLAPKLGVEGGSHLKLLAFYDTGTLGRNFIQPGEQTGLSVDSIGLGLRLVAREKLTFRLDYAQVKHDGGQDPNQTLRDGRRNSNTLHGSLQVVF